MHTRTLVLWPSVIAGAIIALLSATAVFAAAAPAVSYTATGSTPYSTLTVSGSGFKPGETVMVSMGLNTTSAVANGTGAFSGASLLIPNVPSGLYYVIGVGQTSGSVAFSSIWVNSFFPTASPSGWYVNPGSSITWSGSGFAPNEAITIKNSSGATVASFSASASGGFSGLGSMTIPFSQRNSIQTYTLVGGSTGITIPYSIAVADLYPYGSPSSWYARPGTSVTFSGSAFGPGEGVSLYLGTGTMVLAHATADASGNFINMGPVSLPFGSANYRLVGDQSGATASVPVTLAAFYPTITPSAYYAAPGSTITLSGSGFAPNEDVAIKVGATDKGTAHADSLGNFSNFSIKLPPTPNAQPVISGTGAQSAAVGSFTMAIGAYYSWLNLSTWWAQGGTPLTISGHNFAQGETVTATAGGTTIGSATANDQGDAAITATVPYVPPGDATIKLTGGSSGATAQATMTVAPVWTSFELSSYAVNAGSSVNVIGNGYLPGETVSFTIGGTAVGSATAGGTGSFNQSITLPADIVAPGGALATITATSNHSFNKKTIDFWVSRP